jgi:hypothetical protein
MADINDWPSAAEWATPAPQDTDDVVESLRQQLAKCRENFAEHVAGEAPAPLDTRAELVDIVRAGVESAKAPAGLSAEQQARAWAAVCWSLSSRAWKLGDWCSWISDGRTPDEAGDGGVPNAG